MMTLLILIYTISSVITGYIFYKYYEEIKEELLLNINYDDKYSKIQSLSEHNFNKLFVSIAVFLILCPIVNTYIVFETIRTII